MKANRSRWRTASVLIAVLLACACHTLTPEGAKVRITTNPVATTGCSFKGQVDWVDPIDGRNQAAALGGNLIYEQTRPGQIGPARGEVYLCQEFPVVIPR